MNFKLFASMAILVSISISNNAQSGLEGIKSKGKIIITDKLIEGADKVFDKAIKGIFNGKSRKNKNVSKKDSVSAIDKNLVNDNTPTSNNTEVMISTIDYSSL